MTRLGLKGGGFAWLAIVAAMAVLAAASAGGATKTSSGLERAKKNLQAVYDGSLFRSPPTTGPPVQRGKNITLVSIGAVTPGPRLWIKGAREAAKVLGWKLTVFDGQFNPAKWSDGVQQAIATKADGIILDVIDCASVKSALEQARAAGIKVVGISGVDCNVANPGTRSLVDDTIKSPSTIGGDIKGFNIALGKAQADWVTVKTKGKAKIINLVYDNSFKKAWNQGGLKSELKRVCPGCRIVDDVHFVVNDLFGLTLRQKIEQSLLKHPDANAVIAPFDEVITTSGGNAAVRNTGRADQIQVIAATATAGPIQEIKDNKGLDASIAAPLEWQAWAAMDSLNRLFAGRKTVSSGIAISLVDRGHNDQSLIFKSPISFRAAYRKAWNR